MSIQIFGQKQNGVVSGHNYMEVDNHGHIGAHIWGADSTGTDRAVMTTVDGNLSISDNSDGLAIAQGLVTGLSFVHKFGFAPDFDTGDGEVDVWDGAEDNTTWEAMNYTFSTSGIINSISSSDAGDSQTLEIQGLDEDWELTTLSATLSGQTRVGFSPELIRVFRVKNINSTPLSGHAIVYENTAITDGVPDDATKIRAIVHPDADQTEMAIYTIPAGKTAYIRSFNVAQAGGVRSTNYLFKLFARKPGGVFQLKHRTAISSTGNPYQHTYIEPEGPFTEKTDIKMTVQVTAASITAAAAVAGFDLVLVDN